MNASENSNLHVTLRCLTVIKKLLLHSVGCVRQTGSKEIRTRRLTLLLADERVSWMQVVPGSLSNLVSRKPEASIRRLVMSANVDRIIFLNYLHSPSHAHRLVGGGNERRALQFVSDPIATSPLIDQYSVAQSTRVSNPNSKRMQNSRSFCT